MWQRFTDRAKRVAFYAQEEAAHLGENYVSPEHLLLGLVREGDSVAARVLDRLGVPPSRIRAELERRVARGEGRTTQGMTLDPRARKVLDLSHDEARQLNNKHIGTEHLLLGLIREGDGLPARILSKMGVDLLSARREAIAYLGGDVSLVPPEIASVQEGWRRMALQQVLKHLELVVEDFQQVLKSKDLPGDAAEARLIPDRMRGQDLLGIADLSAGDLELIFATASRIKGWMKASVMPPLMAQKTLAMVFEKPSLRTRVSFETGMTQLGGHAINLQPAEVQLGKRESVGDAAKTLSRMVNVIMARTFAHQTVVELAAGSDVPVINGLSDLEHPCQALADFLTIQEKKGMLKGLHIAWVGDGNNVCHSNMLLAAKVGAHFAVACPEGYEPDAGILAQAQAAARETGAEIKLLRDPQAAVKGADVIFTDVWASMGQEAEQEARAKVFAPFQVNRALVDLSQPDSIVLHCLPAHRGDEITDEVMDGPHSVVFDEAENRLHAQKAVLVLLAG